VDSTTGTIKLKASFPNSNLRLWPGAFVTVRLQVEIRKGSITVPPVAVQRGPAGAYVWVLKDDTGVARRPVTVAHEDQTASIIATGIAAGDRVVVDGASRLNDNSRISIATPPGTAPATTAPPRRTRPPGTGDGTARARPPS
jgi:multidrug efflux system membrane fusion protein